MSKTLDHFDSLRSFKLCRFSSFFLLASQEAHIFTFCLILVTIFPADVYHEKQEVFQREAGQCYR